MRRKLTNKQHLNIYRENSDIYDDDEETWSSDEEYCSTKRYRFNRNQVTNTQNIIPMTTIPSELRGNVFLIYGDLRSLKPNRNLAVSYYVKDEVGILSTCQRLPEAINDLFSVLPQKALLMLNILLKYVPDEINCDILNILHQLLFKTIFTCNKCHCSLSSKDNIVYYLHRCVERGCKLTFFCVDCNICNK